MNKKASAWTWVAIVAIVLVIICGSLFVYYIMKHPGTLDRLRHSTTNNQQNQINSQNSPPNQPDQSTDTPENNNDSSGDESAEGSEKSYSWLYYVIPLFILAAIGTTYVAYTFLTKPNSNLMKLKLMFLSEIHRSKLKFRNELDNRADGLFATKQTHDSSIAEMNSKGTKTIAEIIVDKAFSHNRPGYKILKQYLISFGISTPYAEHITEFVKEYRTKYGRDTTDFSTKTDDIIKFELKPDINIKQIHKIRKEFYKELKKFIKRDKKALNASYKKNTFQNILSELTSLAKQHKALNIDNTSDINEFAQHQITLLTKIQVLVIKQLEAIQPSETRPDFSSEFQELHNLFQQYNQTFQDYCDKADEILQTNYDHINSGGYYGGANPPVSQTQIDEYHQLLDNLSALTSNIISVLQKITEHPCFNKISKPDVEKLINAISTMIDNIISFQAKEYDFNSKLSAGLPP